MKITAPMTLKAMVKARRVCSCLLELFFEPKESLASRTFRVACGETELKIDLDRKWLRQPLSAAVVMPFVAAYNKKHSSPLVPTPLSADALSSVFLDGDAMPLAEAAKPTALVLPLTCRRIDLSFGGVGGGVAIDVSDGGASGGSDVVNPAERLKRLWARVHSSPEAVAVATEIKWTNYRLSGADGATISMALLAAAPEVLAPSDGAS